MSLSSVKLNSPQVVGFLGVSCVVTLPFLKGTFQNRSIPFVVVQGVNLCAFGISFWSVSKPGSSGAKEKAKTTGEKEQPSAASLPAKKKKKAAAVPRVRTLLPPDGWSFLIWAPIFVGECLMVGTQVALVETSPLAPIVREVTGSYIFAKAFQVLWTTSFKPEYNQGIYKYIAALNLSGLALSLSFCHRAFTDQSARGKYSTMDYILNFLPLSLHFGWTTVTSLVNWNASYAIERDVSTKEIAYLGHASAVVATAAGTAVTLKRTAPMYGLVLAWALAAIASGVTKRIEAAEQEKDKDEEFILAAKRQRTISIVGAMLCLTASVVAAFGKKIKSR